MSVEMDRRRFLSAAAMSTAALSLGQAPPPTRVKSGSHMSFKPLKQIDAGLLNVGCAEDGPSDGQAVILLHGWPYDIHTNVDVARFLSTDTFRNGQQAAVALEIQKAVFGGFDWGSRTADIIGALWPERVKGMVAVSGYLITNVASQRDPLPQVAELGWWYQYYFSTDRGKVGYEKLIWRQVSPEWAFDDATFNRTAEAFRNPDHAAIVIHNYRWRLGLAQGESTYDEYEQKLFAQPDIAVPTITIGSDFDGPNIEGAAYARKFTGKYGHRVLKGIGHNVPQEAPHAFADAIVAVDSCVVCT